jgi:SWI/SNF-related matrix-associated actin-dependent regulator 1 of chromatin subfamily A
MDECHYIKSIDNYGKATTKRGNSCLAIAEKTEYVFLLTGTPIMNRLKDIFNILRAIDAPIADDWKRFAFRYCDPVNNGFGHNFDGASNTEELYELLQKYMYRKLKSEMLDLPEKLRQFVSVDVDLRAYDRTVKEYMNSRKNGSIKTKGEHLVHLNALRHEMAKAKTEATIEMTETVLENGHQVVVFSCFDYVIDKLMAHFGDSACKITGDVSGINRDKAVEDFQAGKKKILVANIKAGGVGLTLTAGRAVIMNDCDWLPLNMLQCEDRCHRIGTTQSVNIYYMYCEKAAIDQKTTAMMDEKLKNASAVLDGREDSFIDEMIRAFE